MTTLCKTYSDATQAQQAVQALLAAGVPGAQIRVLQGTPTQNTHANPSGGFASRPTADAPVGDFAGGDARTEAEGTFAEGDGHAHDAQHERGGSFADVDRDTVTSFPQGMERVVTTDHPALLQTLLATGLDHAAAERDVAALHQGRLLLIVQPDDEHAAQVQAVLDQAR